MRNLYNSGFNNTNNSHTYSLTLRVIFISFTYIYLILKHPPLRSKGSEGRSPRLMCQLKVLSFCNTIVPYLMFKPMIALDFRKKENVLKVCTLSPC